MGEAVRAGEPRQALAAVIAGDEDGLRRLAELLAPYLPDPVQPAEADRWLCTREAAAYAGTTPSALHKAMAAREIHSSRTRRAGRVGSSGPTLTRGAVASGRFLGLGGRHERAEAAESVAVRRAGGAKRRVGVPGKRATDYHRPTGMRWRWCSQPAWMLFHDLHDLKCEDRRCEPRHQSADARGSLL
jgi:hypothetical protein